MLILIWKQNYKADERRGYHIEESQLFRLTLIENCIDYRKYSDKKRLDLKRYPSKE